MTDPGFVDGPPYGRCLNLDPDTGQTTEMLGNPASMPEPGCLDWIFEPGDDQ